MPPRALQAASPAGMRRSVSFRLPMSGPYVVDPDLTEQIEAIFGQGHGSR
jgi:hypothetical protein